MTNRGKSGALAMAHAYESQAKAGVEGKLQGGDLEPVSRLAGGRTPAATSEKMDETGRRDAHPLATTYPSATDRAGERAPFQTRRA